MSPTALGVNLGLPWRGDDSLTIGQTNPALWAAPDQVNEYTLVGSEVSVENNLGFVGNTWAVEGATFRPDYDTTTFGLASLFFDGADPNCLVYTGANADWQMFVGAANYDIWVKDALQTPPAVATRRMLNIYSAVGNDGGLEHGDAGGTANNLLDQLTRGGVSWLGGNVSSRDTTPHLWRLRYRSGSSGNRTLRVTRDGVIMQDLTGGVDPVPTVPVHPMTWGARRTAASTYTLPWLGWRGRALGYNRAIDSAGLVQLIENYVDASLGGPRQPAFTEDFDADVGFSTVSIGTAGTYAVSGGEATITVAAGGAKDLELRRTTPTLGPNANTGPLVTCEVSAINLDAAGYNVPGVGIAQDGNNLILCEYSQNPNTATYVVRVLVRVGGASTFFAITAETLHAPPYKLGLGLYTPGGGAAIGEIYTDFDGQGLRYRAQASIVGVISAVNLATAVNTWPTCVSFASIGTNGSDVSFTQLQPFA